MDPKLVITLPHQVPSCLCSYSYLPQQFMFDSGLMTCKALCSLRPFFFGHAGSLIRDQNHVYCFGSTVLTTRPLGKSLSLFMFIHASPHSQNSLLQFCSLGSYHYTKCNSDIFFYMKPSLNTFCGYSCPIRASYWICFSFLFSFHTLLQFYGSLFLLFQTISSLKEPMFIIQLFFKYEEFCLLHISRHLVMFIR